MQVGVSGGDLGLPVHPGGEELGGKELSAFCSVAAALEFPH